jgi:hypothetical protein
MKFCGGKNAKEAAAYAISSTKGSTKEFFVWIEEARKAAVVPEAIRQSKNAVFTDTRYTMMFDSINKLNQAVMQAAADARNAQFDPKPVYDRLTTVETKFNTVVADQNTMKGEMGDMQNGLKIVQDLAVATAAGTVQEMSRKGGLDSPQCVTWRKLLAAGQPPAGSKAPKGCEVK